MTDNQAKARHQHERGAEHRDHTQPGSPGGEQQETQARAYDSQRTQEKGGARVAGGTPGVPGAHQQTETEQPPVIGTIQAKEYRKGLRDIAGLRATPPPKRS